MVSYESRSYIINRGWIDRSAKRIPTYNEITSSKKAKNKKAEEDGESSASGSRSGSEAEEEGTDDELDKDEEFEDVNDVFESSYNFRFEEP